MGTGFGAAKPAGGAAAFGGGGTPAASPLTLAGFGAGQPPAAPFLKGLGAAPPPPAPPAASEEDARDVEGEMGEAAEALIRESKVILLLFFITLKPRVA